MLFLRSSGIVWFRNSRNWSRNRRGRLVGAAELIGSRASGGLGKPLGGPGGPMVDFKLFFGCRGLVPGPSASRGCSRRVPRTRVYTFTPPWEGPVRGPWWRQSPALPGLHDVLCRSRSSGSFGLRVAVFEPSAKIFAPATMTGV